MNTTLVRRVGTAAAMVGAALVAVDASAQDTNRPHVTVSAGITEYDLSGTGTTGVAGLGVSFPITAFLSVDPAVGFLRYEPQFGSDASFLMPELSVRFQIPGQRFNPFLAVGGGYAAILEGPGDSDFTLHTAIGSYIWLTRSWALRPEARIRSIDPFVGTTADITFGVSRRL